MTKDTEHTFIPLHLFFGKSQKDQVRLSPGGTWLAWRERDPDTGVLNLWVLNRHKSSNIRRPPAAKQVTFETERDVCLQYWFSCDDQTLIYLREPKNGSELYHLYALDLDLNLNLNLNDKDGDGTDTTPKIRDLIPDSKTTCTMGFAGGLQVWLDSVYPRYIYTSTAACGVRSLFWNISRIHLDTCQMETIQHNPLSTWSGLSWFALCSLLSFLLQCIGIRKYHPRATVQWFPDTTMNFRGKLEISLINLSCAWRVFDREQNIWKQMHCVEWKDANMSLVGSSGGSGTAHFGFPPTSDGSDLVDLHLCNMRDTTSYERFDIATGEHLETLACHDQSDITSFLSHPKTRQVQAVTYNYEKPSIVCLQDCSDSVRQDLDYLRQTFSGATFDVLSRTMDDTIWVVYVQSDKGLSYCQGSPSGYFIFQRGQSLTLVATPQPELAKYGLVLATMTPVHIPARDGENLLCYLSTPPSFVQHGKSPLVLFIHGGPQARDIWQFHPFCQLLCNRGMCVLQVNYRGSTGMGSRFVKIGMNGVFATQLQEDIQDAAQYAIKQKWCSPDRIAIMGASFGGYCSLAAMTFMADETDRNPHYQCAVAICPPSIFGAANPHKAFYGNPLIAKYWKQVFGPAISNSVQASEAISPMFHMEKIQKPVLILHGEDDPRAPIEQSDQAFQKLKVESSSEYVRFGKEGHGIRKEQNLLYMAHCIERFLCRHLGLPEPPRLEEFRLQGHTATPVTLQQGECLSSEKKDKDA